MSGMTGDADEQPARSSAEGIVSRRSIGSGEWEETYIVVLLRLR